MDAYLGGVLSTMLSTVFIIFLISTVGYLIGGIEIKGISLGTAGVLLVALIFGVIANQVSSFEVAGSTVTLYSDSIKSLYSMVSSLGTAMFVTAVGLIAGPKFFRNLNKSMLSYVFMGAVVIGLGVVATIIIIKVTGISSSLAVGLLTGGLTSTPGLSAAKDAALDTDAVTAGYGIAYIFGILGVVFFVQLAPKVLKVNIEEERKSFISAGSIKIVEKAKKLKKIDTLDFFPFVLTIVLGNIVGAFSIPGINFSLGSAGGTLIVGLIVGHFGHIGNIDLSINKNTLNFFRELGLVLFLVGAGIPGGISFVNYVEPQLFIYGAILTLVPMFGGFLLGKYVFKLSIFNNLGSLTGGMTSTPALGTLISVAKTDEVAAAYAATYPISLVLIVLASKAIVMFL
ncbi:MAG: YidE/YbjL duplication [Clostridia bacterium]